MSTFHLFSLLPPEIRIRIWNCALNIPTIVQLCFTAQDPLGWDMRLVSRRIPTLLHTSRESRSQALKIFPTKLPGPRETYINFTLDTTVLSSATMPYHIEWVTETLAFRGSLDVSHVRHLAIDFNWWRSFDISLRLRNLTLFGSVESLTLFVEEADGGYVRFEEIEDGDGGLLWDYDSEVEFGVRNACRRDLDALKRSYDEILENEQHEDYELVIDWKLPELKAMKLKGNILNQVSKDLATEKGWHTIGA
ncbi:hypothetical protein BGZ60DRAFT_552657 [Tricladium varicosporioides]|nr:hypothetical protein BGZ60DRAFT_552657 [Hymenoscyphus varicosporioides]